MLLWTIWETVCDRMKIWRGNEYNKRGEKQLAEYLEYYHFRKGIFAEF